MVSLGPFELEFLLGRGGMGEVWAAMHKRRQIAVAVKLLTVEVARDRRGAFRNEVRAMAGLDHPHIVRVFDYGDVSEEAAEASNGNLTAETPYLVMELADRGSLNRLRGRMRWFQIREVVLALLDALAHAHARGVVHRDLKPGNVLLGEGRTGVKLTDFGLAHAVRRAHQDRASEDHLAGTPAYMAPEQIEGSWRDYGPWTDLYALGCLAWALTTGKAPFDADNAHLTMLQQVRNQVPPLSAPVAVPEGFEGWLRTLLQKDPALRFRRAADAAWALDRLSTPTDDATERMDWELTLEEDSLLGPEEPSRSMISLDLAVGAFPELDEAARRAKAAYAPLGRAAPLRPEIPPLPESWQRPPMSARPFSLIDVGIGLFGLRATELVGREAERDLLWELVHVVRDAPEPRLAVIQGAAGVGKTRLAEWIAERAHELGGATVLRVGCGPDMPAGTGLSRLASDFLRCEGMGRTAVQSRVRAVLTAQGVADPDEQAAMAELIAPAGRLRFPGERAVVFQNPVERYVLVRRMLQRVAHERPAIAILDDAGWDVDLLAFVAHLLEETREEPLPLVLILTTRDEVLAASTPEAALLGQLCSRGETEIIELGPLPPEDRPALVRNLLGLEGRLAAEVEERTGGNPSFAVELVGDWVQRGVLELGDEGFGLPDDVRVEVPASLLAVWEGRIDAILSERPEEAGIALELAAVLGQEVDGDEWRVACDLAGVERPWDAVEALEEGRLVRTGHAGREAGFELAHSLLRESLERRAEAAGRLKAHHRVVAQMLMEVEGVDVAERVGRHLLGAGDLEAALAPLTRAVRMRLERGDSGVAGVLLARRERAMNLLDLALDDHRWGEGWVYWAQYARARGRHDDADSWAARAVDAARQHGWPDIYAKALRERGRLASTRGEPTLAWRRLRKAEDAAEELGLTETIAQCRRDMAGVLVSRGALLRAEGLYEAAVALYEEAGDARGAAMATLGRVEVYRQSGDHDRARELLFEARARFEAAGSRSGLAMVANDLGDIYRLDGDLEEAEASYRDALRRLDALGPSRAEITRVNLALVLIERGRYREARALLDTSLVAFSAANRRGLLGAVHTCLLPCAAAERDWTDFDAHLARAAALLEETGQVDVDIARMARLGGQIALEHGEADKARGAFAVAMVQLRALDRGRELGEIEAVLATL